MNSREKINRIFNQLSKGAVGFWTGNPYPDTEKLYLEKLGVTSREELFEYLHDDCRWVIADRAYKHPEGKPIFDIYGGRGKKAHGEGDTLLNASPLRRLRSFHGPILTIWIFRTFWRKCASIRIRWFLQVFGVLSSILLPIFFGMENYFIKMYTYPAVVEAVTNHVIYFLAEANERFFTVLGNDVDTFFFGNDFGTQLDLLISPEAFKRFVLPGLKKLIDVARKHHKKVLLHSCGSIYKIIPLLIDAGVDALHPLQAKAANMDTQTLAREFKNHIAFVGGVDTQELLIKATPQQIKDEVRRLRELLGPNLIISPSHEAILSNVPLENVIAMAEAARE
ncbi:uroporphyrinogen decarboxylase [Caldicoprobacter guelmensis]|uniref:uroporphyrinogen decarboxylase family protein n=1 Tax=Caldicoprobacter guelmensis TaxID=1170224 RepID=UPI00195DAF47|nr:uroporphyrinogen decarboxylase family protein [Caldicoprobacter guelmensis]MBM7583367.1 uroporphyrinogen decarboxylase [Caldicoprobacter guelmensis]